MITPEIISYIKSERSKNISDSVIKSNLLANGWNESDINDAIFSLSTSSTLSSVQKPIISSVDMKKHRNKVLWTTFSVLLVIDILIILWFKLNSNMWGIFGISPISVAIRILVIYLISVFSAQNSLPQDKTYKTVGQTILKVFGTILLAVLIGVGLLFAYCLFAFR